MSKAMTSTSPCPSSSTPFPARLPSSKCPTVEDVRQSQLFPNSSGPANCRKRRADLQRIDLSNCAAKKLIAGSSESLNSGSEGDGLQSPSGNEDCLSIAGTESEGEEGLKRLRLRSQSSQSSALSPEDTEQLGQSSTDWHSREQVFLASDVAKKLLAPNLAELEAQLASGSGGGSSSARHVQLSSGGLVLEDELLGSKFELVGDGRNCKAVEANSQNVWHCQIVKLEEFKQIAEVMARMQAISGQYSEDEFEWKSNLLLPIRQLRILRSPQRRGLVYLLLPDHFGTLHQPLEESELACPGGGPARLSEQRAQPILRQVAALLEFCHRIGLHFRDFRLRKFVFTDMEKTQIRVNNLLDLSLAPDPACDWVVSREFIPAYVAPEVLDKKNEQYGAKAADVWAFGVLMFTLLNGRYPFFEASPSPIALLRRIRAHRFTLPILESISAPARWLIHSLLCPNPGDRPTAGQLLQAHWFRAKMDQSAEEKLAGLGEANGAGCPWERAKSISPTSALYLLPATAIRPVSSALNSLRSSPPAGQVPSRRSPPLAGEEHRRPPLSRHVRALVLQESISGLLALGQRAAGPRTASESRQIQAVANGPSRGQPPAFVPLGTWTGAQMSGRRIAGNGPNQQQNPLVMHHLMPLGLMAHLNGQFLGREARKQATNVGQAGSTNDQIVPEAAPFGLRI